MQIQPTIRFFLCSTLLLISGAVGDVVAQVDPPGVVVNQSPDIKKIFIGNPSIAVLPNGDLVATHDQSGAVAKKNCTYVFGSSDAGQTWKPLSIVSDQRMSTLFVHRNELYLLGTDRPYGNLVIRKSSDSGKTWTTPRDEKTGLLSSQGLYHTSPVPVTLHQGRLWRSIDRFKEKTFQSRVISAAEDADLLDASNWRNSNSIAATSDVLGGQKDRIFQGNIVSKPDGTLVCLQRVNHGFAAEQVAAIEVNSDGSKLAPKIQHEIIEMPGGKAKFTIRFDKSSGKYWAIVNAQREPFALANRIALISSDNLINWKHESEILYHTDSSLRGFSNIDWQFDGKDLVMVNATAWEGATGIYNANFLTFHRIPDFRNRTDADAPTRLGKYKSVSYEFKDFQVSGVNFRINRFKNLEPAFTNRRQFTWSGIPTPYDGWSYTQLSGGVFAEIKLKVKRDCNVFFSTNIGREFVDVSGWHYVPNSEHQYGVDRHGHSAIFGRAAKAGDELVIPQGGWSGSMLLIQPDS